MVVRRSVRVKLELERRSARARADFRAAPILTTEAVRARRGNPLWLP